MHTKFNKKPYASYINDFASFNLMTLESPPPFFPPVYTRFNPVRPAVQPYQFSAVLAFDLQDGPLRLRPLIVQNAPPAFGVGASDHFHLPPPPLHSGQ